MLFDLFLVDQAVAYSHYGLLDVHGQIDAILESVDVLPFEVKRVIGIEEVVIETLMDIRDAIAIGLLTSCSS